MSGHYESVQKPGTLPKCLVLLLPVAANGLYYSIGLKFWIQIQYPICWFSRNPWYSRLEKLAFKELKLHVKNNVNMVVVTIRMVVSIICKLNIKYSWNWWQCLLFCMYYEIIRLIMEPWMSILHFQVIH